MSLNSRLRPVTNLNNYHCRKHDQSFHNSLKSDDSLEGKMAVDPLKNKRCSIKAQIFAQRAFSGAAGVKM
jgi:hypothetical protein